MPSLTVGGQVRELRLTNADLEQTEEQLLKLGGRRILDMFRNGTSLSMRECRWMLWGAWRKTCQTDDQVWALVNQFYEEGGTFPDVHREVLAMLTGGGLLVKPDPENGTGPPGDPPGAGASS